MMDKEFNGYTATQTEKGFHVVFHDTSRDPVELKFSDFQEFAAKYNQELSTGSIPKLTGEEEVMLSIWQMLLIPDSTVH
jgi:hypothetical protein